MQPERKIRMITSCYDEALDRIKWLELGLKMVIKHSLDKEVKQMAQAYLDGEPTTADEYNESQEIEGIELKQELKSQYSDIDIAKSMIDEIDKQLEEEE